MPTRSYWIPAAVLWFASTGWLFSTKILPTLTKGTPPAYSDLLPRTAVRAPEPIRWSIRWNGKEIGRATNKITREFDGTGRITSEVKFNQLPVDDLIRDAMGIFGRFAGKMTGEIGPLDLYVITNLDFDNYGELRRLNTRVDIGSLEELLSIDGIVKEDTLDLAARLKTDGTQEREVYRDREIKLPPDALVADTFSPRPKLANLKVGQTWTFQSYQPLMPHSPLTLIEAKVTGKELIEWQGRMVRVMKVVFQKDSGSGISTTRRPVSETWVTKDGTVLRQDLWLASVKVQFIRQSNDDQNDEKHKVETNSKAQASEPLQTPEQHSN